MELFSETLQVLNIVLLFSLDISSTKEIVSKNSRFVTNAVVHQLSEMLKTVIKNGNLDEGIPILDPYKLDYVQLDLPGELLSLKANVTNAILSGLGDYEFINSDFDKDEISIDLNIMFPAVYFEAEYYEMEGNVLGAFPLSGIGGLQIEMHNFYFWSKVYLKQSDDGKSILIDRMEDADFTVDHFRSRTEFDGNIDDIFNAMVEDLLADYLNRFSRFMAAKYSESVIEILNPYLNNFESWRILAVII